MSDRFNPEMLVRARESRRMTQAALAKASGTTQGTISKAENAQLAPSREVVDAWAAALRYPPSLFARENPPGGLPLTFFRKKASLAVTAAKAITATVDLRRAQVERLARSVELPEPRVPARSPTDTGRSPSDLAAELRIAWRVPHGRIENLTAVLEGAGVVVVQVDFGADGIDGLSIFDHKSGAPPVMFISARSPMDRLRFTMAHELGHMVMHHHQTVPPETCEDEANEFASEFLMPAADIRSELGDLSLEKLAHLKLRWRVSMGSLLVRAKSLNRITEGRATRMWKQLSRLGYRTREPVEVPREEPALVGELVRVHLESLGYTAAELASAIDLLTDEFNEQYLGQAPGLRLVR